MLQQGDDASKGGFPCLGVSEKLRSLSLFAGTRIRDGKSCLTEALMESGVKLVMKEVDTDRMTRRGACPMKFQNNLLIQVMAHTGTW